MAHMGALGLAALLALASGDAAAEISGDVVRIGVLNDHSGVYSDGNGQGSVVAARMAVEDVGELAPSVKVEIVFADHQNKPDVGAEIARRWLDTEAWTRSSTSRPPRWRWPSSTSPAPATRPSWSPAAARRG